MIIDKVTNLKKYANIPNIRDILRFLDNKKITCLPCGDISIIGQDLYLKVLRYRPKAPKQNKFEIHRKYTDVQIIIKGVEMMQVAPLECLKKTRASLKDDFVFFSGNKYISEIVARKGDAIVFFPEEAHKPGCSYKGIESQVTKLVFKTRRKA